MSELADVVQDDTQCRPVAPVEGEGGEQAWELSVDPMPQIICVLDAGERILWVNQQAEIWGLKRAEAARGQRLHDYLHPGCDGDCILGPFWSQARIELQNDWHTSWQGDDPVLGRHIEIAFHPASPVDEEPCRDESTFAIALISDIGRAKAVEAMQRRQKAELDALLRALSAQLLNIQEEERKRIASELHDSIGQTLSVLKFGVEDILRRLAAESLDDTREMLALLCTKTKDAIDEVRQISMNLRPSILDDLGIVATMTWFVREFQRIRRDIAVDLEIGIQEAEVPGALKTAIYRILQEAMHNIAEHAQTSRVRIRFGWSGEFLELTIEDFGNGFDNVQVMARMGSKKGYGLISMRDRALLSGADFRIDTRAGAGTQIRVRWLPSV